MFFYTWAYYKRNKESYTTLTGASDLWGVCSKSLGYWFGITVIVVMFQTSFAFDIFLSVIDLFSDGDSQKAGLKFMF
jgi:predicted alternative tryptophan synthase beta-subunit